MNGTSGATGAVVEAVEKAQHSILVQAYSFSSAPIAKALLTAHQRGVTVEVLLNRSQRSQKYSSAGQTVITGSFNFTRAAEEKNAENRLS